MGKDPGSGDSGPVIAQRKDSLCGPTGFGNRIRVELQHDGRARSGKALISREANAFLFARNAVELQRWSRAANDLLSEFFTPVLVEQDHLSAHPLLTGQGVQGFQH